MKTQITYAQAEPADADALADVRVAAMRESLKAIGRFNSSRARHRFLDAFEPEATHKIIVDGQVVGFYMASIREDHVLLDHLYILPSHQRRGFGSRVVERVKDTAREKSLPVKLGALKDSPSNRFYLSHGFVLSHEEEWDCYYEWHR